MNRYYIITGRFNGVDTFFDGKSWSIYEPRKFESLSECEDVLAAARKVASKQNVTSVKVVGVK